MSKEQEYKKDNSAISDALKIGAVIGGGALAIKNRRVIGRGYKGVRSFAGKQAGRAYTAAAKNILAPSKGRETLGKYKRFGAALSDGLGDKTGVFKALRNTINPEGSQFNSRFNQSIERQINNKQKKATSPTYRNSTEMSRWHYENVETRKAALKEFGLDDVRQQEVRKKIDKTFTEDHEKMLYQMLVEYKGQKGEGIFTNPNENNVADFTRLFSSEKALEEFGTKLNFKNEEHAQDFVKKLMGTLEEFKDEKAPGLRSKKSAIQQSQENVQKAVDDAFQRKFSKESNRSVEARSMSKGGYEHVTFQDYRRLGLDMDDLKVPKKDGSDEVINMIDEIEKKYGGKIDLNELIVDKHIYAHKKTGEIVDLREHNNDVYKMLSFAQDAFQMPFLRFNFLDLAHFGTIRAVKEQPGVSLMQAGQTYGFVQHNLSTFEKRLDVKNSDAVFKPLDRGGYMYAEGNIYDIRSGQVVDSNVYTGPQNYGILGRMHNNVGNLKERAVKKRGPFSRTVDIGGQQEASFFSDIKGAFTKLASPNYGPNLQNSIMGAQFEENTDRVRKTKEYYDRMKKTLSSGTDALSSEAVHYMSPKLNEGFKQAGMKIDINNLYSDEDIIDAVGQIVQKTQKSGNPSVYYSSKGNQEADGLIADLHDYWARYYNNATMTLKSKDMGIDKSVALPDSISPMQLHEPTLVKSTERARKLIQQYAIRQMEMNENRAGIARELVEEGFKKGILSKSDVKEVAHIETLNKVTSFRTKLLHDDFDISQEGVNEFVSELVTNQQFSGDLQKALTSVEPFWAKDLSGTKENLTGSNTQIFRKHKSYTDKLTEINQSYKEQGKVDGFYEAASHAQAGWQTIKELFAGRKNPNDVTTMTSGLYYYAERLDNAVAGLALGLSQEKKGSALSIIGNQFLRRIVMPYAMYEQAVWLDGQFNDFASNKLADTYVNMHEGLSSFKEVTGINRAMGPWADVFQGADQLAELPFVKAFNFATMGALSDWRSGEEVKDFYEGGEVAIRKNRYWGIGSGSPFAGSGVEYYSPNWYRKMKSDYKFTDTMYGDESEYWANHWMPTLTNPLAPLKHFFFDPYHYENKHKEDRPYAVTGGFSEIQQIPIIGPAIDGTIGRIIKPRQEHAGLEKAHRKYIKTLNDNVKEQYSNLDEGKFVERGVAGGVSLYDLPTMKTADSMTSEEEANISMLMGETEDSYFSSAQIATFGQGGKSVNAYVASPEGSSLYNIASYAKMDLTTRNQLAAAGGTGGPSMSIDSYSKILNPNIVYDSGDISSKDNVSGIVRDAFYSASEIGGIYGFMTKTGIGFEESGRGTTWADSSLMTSYARSFWDMGLGSIGGQLSEIGRRYVPRDPNKQYYSPIENDMPDWMPGLDYFLDFQHGDPYVKVKRGETRLAGDAYASLYQLHGDGTGEGKWEDYGIFDRYRILADVAPYSSQYKQAKAMVSKMNESGMLSDDMLKEYNEIKEQVQSRKDKYRWYEKKFTNAKIKKESVTVTRVLDENTFLTREYGNNPIRLAGVKLNKDNEEANAWLSQFITEGAKLKIGLEGDARSRVNKDTMNTMSAVVYAPHGEEGVDFSYSIKGQSLNYILANRKWSDSEVKKADNDTAVSTRALYSSDMVFVGKMWEGLTHDILPQIPILGVFADKFLQVRTPVESYERDQVYGKEWKPWTEPIKSWIVPMAQTITSRSPIVAAAEGAGIGHLVMTKKYRGRGRIVGAAIGGLSSSIRVIAEEADGLLGSDSNTWIPERRQKERDINEYFDRIKYVKYRGLYEKAKALAKQKEGIDLDDYFNEARERGDENKGLRRYLAEKKKWLSISKKSGYGDKEHIKGELDKISGNLKEIESNKTLDKVGPYSALAIQYKKEYESTLYGLDPKNSDMRDVLKALTPKEKEYFPKFLEAKSQKERNKISGLVSDDMRRILHAKWGMKADKKEDIGTYFSKKNLPGKNWEGWSANTSLDNIKIKVMKKEGVELSEAGYWADDEKRAEQSGVEAIPTHGGLVSSKIDVGRLEDVLAGAGLSDVRVSMNVSNFDGESKIQTGLNILRDVKNDITSEINRNIENIFST